MTTLMGYRIVTITSGMLYYGKVDLEDIQMEKVTDFGDDNILAYSASKLEISIFMRELGKRLEKSGTTTYSVCPGFVDTDMTKNDAEQEAAQSWSYKFVKRFFMYTPEQVKNFI